MISKTRTSAWAADTYAEQFQALLDRPPAGMRYPRAVERAIFDRLNRLRRAKRALGLIRFS